MVGAWNIYGDELSKIVFPESWGDALLQRVIVSDDISNICTMISTLLWGMDNQEKSTIQDVVDLPRRRFEEKFRDSLNAL